MSSIWIVELLSPFSYFHISDTLNIPVHSMDADKAASKPAGTGADNEAPLPSAAEPTSTMIMTTMVCYFCIEAVPSASSPVKPFFISPYELHLTPSLTSLVPIVDPFSSFVFFFPRKFGLIFIQVKFH